MSDHRYESYERTNSTSEHRKLCLNRDKAWGLGVCAGIADYFGLDPALIRVGAIVGAMFMPKTLVAAYLVSWLVLDDRILPKNR